MINFEWDPAKAEINIKKHGISFEEATSVFYDEYAMQFFDEKHSDIEFGSNDLNVLIVCHCERDNGNMIRIISSRKTTKNEMKYYNRGHSYER
mgnify:CR=1 FL=1